MNKNSMINITEELEKLAKLKEQGILTDSEFQHQKNKILGIQSPQIPKVKKNSGCSNTLLIIGGIFLFIIIMIYRIGSSSEATEQSFTPTVKSQLENVYSNFCLTQPHLRFIGVTQTTEDSFVVEIEVDKTIEVSSDNNSREKNLRITQKWTDLVSLSEAKTIARNNNLYILSVKQIDKKGNLHSIAIVN